jgi:hypothetical protein
MSAHHRDSYNFPHPLSTTISLVRQVVILLTYMFATKIWSYGELGPWHIIHILGFISPNFLHISLMIMAALAVQ